MIDRLRSGLGRRLPIPFGAPYALQHSPSQRLRTEHGERLRRYADYRTFYAGTHFDPRARGKTQLVLNYARAIVDKGVSYLFGKGIQLIGETPAAQSALDLLLDDDALTLELLQGATNAAVCGDACLKVYWTGSGVRVINLDPALVYPTFSGEDASLLLEVAICSTLRPAEARARFGLVTAVDVEILETWTREQLVISSGNDILEERANPYGFIPVEWVRNMTPPNSPFGQSDLVDVIPINRELDLRMSDFSDTVRFHADPPVIFKGVDRRDQTTVVGPGNIWDIPKDADVELLEWSGEAPAVGEHLERLLESIFRLAESPRSSFGDVKLQLSGVALELELAPLVQRTLRKRLAWGIALRHIAADALRLYELGAQAEALSGSRIKVEWPPLLPRDIDAEATREINLTAAGIHSHRTAMEIVDVEKPEEELTRVVADRERLNLMGDEATPAERAGGEARESGRRGGATV